MRKALRPRFWRAPCRNSSSGALRRRRSARARACSRIGCSARRATRARSRRSPSVCERATVGELVDGRGRHRHRLEDPLALLRAERRPSRRQAAEHEQHGRGEADTAARERTERQACRCKTRVFAVHRVALSIACAARRNPATWGFVASAPSPRISLLRAASSGGPQRRYRTRSDRRCRTPPVSAPRVESAHRNQMLQSKPRAMSNDHPSSCRPLRPRRRCACIGADHVLRRRELPRPHLLDRQAGAQLRARRLQRPGLVGRRRPRPLGGVRGRALRGPCVVLRRGSYDSLRGMGLDNRISSVRPVEDRRNVANEAPAPLARPNYDYRRTSERAADEVPVTSARAVMGRREQRCWVERPAGRRRRKARPQRSWRVIGGVLGGILGHQVGGGSGKDGGDDRRRGRRRCLGANVDRIRDRASGQDVGRCENVRRQRPSTGT